MLFVVRDLLVTAFGEGLDLHFRSVVRCFVEEE